MVATARTAATVEEYFAMERQGEERLEYRDGMIIAMVGGSEAHGLIQLGIGSLLRVALRDRNCFVYPSDVKVHIAAANIYTYPDISVVCGKREFTPGRHDAILNPILLVEVLSPNTEIYDRGKKFSHYRRIPSLREYVLVAQDMPMVEHYVLQEDGTWNWAAVEGLRESITLSTIGCTLDLGEIYRQVEFTTDESAPGQEGQG
jgi:Uma2 family endonuclease